MAKANCYNSMKIPVKAIVMLKCRAMEKIAISIHQTNPESEQGCKLVEAYALVVGWSKVEIGADNSQHKNRREYPEIRILTRVCCLN